MLRVVGAREGTADALDRAHRAGVTHHDINLGNLMLTRDGVKVLDFRIAKSTAKPGPTEATIVASLTSEGTVLGTPQYMAPEQFERKKPIRGRTCGPSLPLPPSPLWFLGLTSSEEGKQQVYVQSMQSLGAKPLAGTGGAVASEHWAGARFITSPLPAFGKFAIALPQYALR